MAYQYRGKQVEEEPTIVKGVVLGIQGRPLSLCGTDSGYKRHRSHKERSCDPCREAHRLKVREQRGTSVRKLPECGTMPGYRRHIYRKEKPCDKCREANTLYTREYREKRRAEKLRNAKSSTCGTPAAYRKHVRLGEDCEKCRKANTKRTTAYRKKNGRSDKGKRNHELPKAA